MTGHHTPPRWRRLAALGAVLLVALLSSSIAAPQAGAATPTIYVPISGAGSTWSFNAIDAWRRNVVQYGMTINYAAVGSSVGRTDFHDGSVDWAASDIPYGVKDGNNDDPPPTRGFAYMPDTAGGTTFMYNLVIGNQRVTNLRLSGASITGIFTGTITRWNDPAIVRDNPGLNMPAKPIVPVVRSDGSGSTAQFTKWIDATQHNAWLAYCGHFSDRIGALCTPTSAYPVLPGSGMHAQAGDLGVSAYVGQQGADGAIGYVEYSYALQAGFPVAKVLNSAGYYTEPTPGHVAVSLLKAQIDTQNINDPTKYLTQDLSQVYTNIDARTYPLSSYSYMILPTKKENGLNDAKGLTLGDFGKYLLCQGQNQVDVLGYSALPINLVQAGFDQLRKIPGANIPNINIQTCNNPTFSTDSTNTLANTDPQPQPCDKQGPLQCTAGTGGAAGHNTPGKPGTTGTGGSGAGGAAAAGGGTGAAGTGGGGTGGATSTGAQVACDPSDPSCASGSGSANTASDQQISAVPLASDASLGDGMQVVLMILAAVLLLALGLAPPLIGQAMNRRRRQRGGVQ